MNSLRNRVQLIGRLGSDPEIRNLEKGNKMAKFSLATSESNVAKDGKKTEETQWHNLVVWGKLSEVCEKYLKKGKEVVIQGRLTYRNWEDKNGSKHTSAEIVMTEMLFVGAKAEEAK